MPIEFAKLTVIKKDGSNGPQFSICENIAIGRSKQCEIRIKLESVSKVHAAITIDQNGNCFLHHSSKTNPTFLNSYPIVNPTILLNGDRISICDREFIFNTAFTQPAGNQSPDSKPSRLPILTPLLKAIRARRRSSLGKKIEEETIEEKDESAEKSQAHKLKTPLRKAIQLLRRKSGDESSFAMENIASSNGASSPKSKETEVETKPEDAAVEELVASLSEQDYAALESYAEKFDEFHSNNDNQQKINDAETFINKRLSIDNGPINLGTDAVAVAPEPAVESATDSSDINIEESLRDLFKLPLAYMTADDDDRDHEMVVNYSKDITQNSGMDEDVAYGIALDTFLADPVLFRHRIGGLPLNQYVYSMKIVDDINNATEEDGPVDNNKTVAVDDDMDINKELLEETKMDVVEPVTATAPSTPAPEPKTPAKSTRKRGRTSTVQIEESTKEETEDAPQTESKPKRKRGRTAEPEEETTDEAPVEAPVDPVTPAGKRTRKATVTIEEVKTPMRSTRKRGKTEETDETTEENKLEPITPRRSTRVTTKQPDVPPSTAKRGRPKKVESESEEEALALICDGCDGDFFLEDLGLKKVPEGEWFCDVCSGKSAKKPARGRKSEATTPKRTSTRKTK